MKTLKQISNETLTKADVLNNQQMKKVRGGSSQRCWIKCGDIHTEIEVDGCDIPGTIHNPCYESSFQCVCVND